MITDYTSYDEVRAVLGVDDDELDDTKLALGAYSSDLNFELNSFGTGFVTYLDAKLAEDYETLTEKEQLFVDSAKLFATYSVASNLSVNLPMFALKEQSDSKASQVRFNDSFKGVLANVSGRLEAYRNRLRDLFDELNPGVIVVTPATLGIIFTSSTPTADPVTGA